MEMSEKQISRWITGAGLSFALILAIEVISQRALFADGVIFLLEIMRNHGFSRWDFARQFVHYISQWPRSAGNDDGSAESHGHLDALRARPVQRVRRHPRGMRLADRRGDSGDICYSWWRHWHTRRSIARCLLFRKAIGPLDYFSSFCFFSYSPKKTQALVVSFWLAWQSC